MLATHFQIPGSSIGAFLMGGKTSFFTLTISHTYIHLRALSMYIFFVFKIVPFRLWLAAHHQKLTIHQFISSIILLLLPLRQYAQFSNVFLRPYKASKTKNCNGFTPSKHNHNCYSKNTAFYSKRTNNNYLQTFLISLTLITSRREKNDDTKFHIS